MAEEHERREDRGGLVEDLAAPGQGDAEGVDPAGADGDRHQHHHVERPGAQGPPGSVEEDPCRVEDDRQAQQQHEDVVA